MSKVPSIFLIFASICMAISSANHFKVEKFIVSAPLENTRITYKNGEGKNHKFI